MDESKIVAENLKTKEDLVEKIDSLNSLRMLVFKDNSVDKTALNQAYLAAFGRNIDENLSSNREALSTLIDQTQNYLESLKVVNLTLAFEPSHEFLLRLKKFFQEALGQTVVINLVVNPTIIGGVILENNGKYLDYSSAAILDSAFQDRDFLTTLLQPET